MLLLNQGLPQVLHDRLASRFVPPVFVDTVLRRSAYLANAMREHWRPEGAIAESKVTPTGPKMLITDANQRVEPDSRDATAPTVVRHICNTGRDTVSHIRAAVFAERVRTPCHRTVAYRLRPESA